MDPAKIIYGFDLFGVAVFAVSGSLAAGRKQMDVFGVVVLGLVTALGGGTLRDTLLDAGPVFWIDNRVYLLVAVAAALLTFTSVRIIRVPLRGLLIFDAIGLAVFMAIGTAKTLAVTNLPSISMIMGVITGVAGGMIRDILSAEVPLILRKEVYATAALCGSLVYVVMNRLNLPDTACLLLSATVTLLIRLAAIHYNFALPVFRSRDELDNSSK
ncbi:MAG: trimeric intracellular cation channel family protein [Deltaproteobacteria bacterium]|nr:trimeric intracellular cation channel family protein [Deltaproteobacteria bacterium]